MRVAVTGVASSIGQRVIALLDSDPEVDSIIGLDVTEPARTARKLEFHLCDIATSDLKSVLIGADVLVQIADSVKDRPLGIQNGSRESDAAATRRLLAAAGDSSVARVVRVASAAVYGAWENNLVPIGEETALRPNSGYTSAAIDAECERLIIEWSDAHPSAEAIVLRLAPVIGPTGHDKFAPTPTTALQLASNDNRLVQFIHVDDVASAIEFAVKSDHVGAYNVAANGHMTATEAEAVVGNVHSVLLRLRGVAKLLPESLRTRSHGHIPSEARPYLTHSWVIATDRIRAAGWEPRFSNEDALLLINDIEPAPAKSRWIAALVAGAAGAMWWLRRKRRPSK